MKIVTVNIPEAYLEAINRLLDNKEHPGGLYPSRSELIRVAVREFLIKELERAEELIKIKAMPKKEKKEVEFDDKNFVRIPNNAIDEDGKSIREFKTYKIVKRLEY